MGAREVVLQHGAEIAVDLTSFSKEDSKFSFLGHIAVPYPKFWGDFQTNLSALDHLLCTGSDGQGALERGVRRLRAT